ncbi:ribosomal-protein-alanine N-acetyltransferase [Melghiribacillus thermohalophilus]|uniref:Ribosomal-protein-alanine N-acetyltransferase n=2 Tax=Melghiribacillus thermohalophilus TaxID=1324956 RepID=A0A4R3MV14_9BACI|nr:ribosomal-protein-alanine N-acetyltransferase [Melghiribacillus thermohalophilus]
MINERIKQVFLRFPVIETERLQLRQPDFHDIHDIFDIYSDEEVMRYNGMDTHQSLHETRELIQWIHKMYDERKNIRWGIILKENKEYVGSCGFHHFDEHFTRAKIGYEIKRRHWRKGIASEAIQKVIEFGFHEMNLNRIEAVVDGDNEASKKLLLKLGFTYEGCLRNRFYFKDRFWHEYYFGLLKSDDEKNKSFKR